MIRVSILDDDEDVGSVILVEDPLGSSNDETISYHVTITVDRGPSIGIYRRKIVDWPINAINPIGLVKAALSQLDEEHIAIEESDDSSSKDKAPSPSTLERRLAGFMRGIQAGPS